MADNKFDAEAKADEIVSWLEDFTENNENLMIGTRVQLQLRIAEALREREAECAGLREALKFYAAGLHVYEDTNGYGAHRDGEKIPHINVVNVPLELERGATGEQVFNMMKNPGYKLKSGLIARLALASSTLGRDVTEKLERYERAVKACDSYFSAMKCDSRIVTLEQTRQLGEIAQAEVRAALTAAQDAEKEVRRCLCAERDARACAVSRRYPIWPACGCECHGSQAAQGDGESKI